VTAALITLLALTTSVVVAHWRTRLMTRRLLIEEGVARAGESLWQGPGPGPQSELGGALFDSSDWAVVRREASPPCARRFQEERTALALEWLRQLRQSASSLMSNHAKAVRSSAALSVSGELRLASEFFAFQLLTGVLYGAVWLCGPFHVAALAGYSIDISRRLKEAVEDVLPARVSFAGTGVTAQPQQESRPAAD
jgi:hypothetical protein